MPDLHLMALLSSEVTPETNRMAVYAMAVIVGLAVSGLITIAKDIRTQRNWTKRQSILARLYSLI